MNFYSLGGFMRCLKVGLFLIATVSCGKGDSGGKADLSNASKEVPAAEPNKNAFPSLAFNAETDLPACTTAINGALAYIKSSGVFKNCEAGNWVVLPAAEDKDSGKIIKVSNVSYGADLDGWNYKDAVFRGSVIYYADGTKFLLGSMEVLTNLSDVGDSDFVISNIPMNMITTPQKPLVVFSVGADAEVDIDGSGPEGDHRVFVAFNEESKIWQIYLDLDDNGEDSDGDMLLGALTETAI
jgi:hypothetical protein